VPPGSRRAGRQAIASRGWRRTVPLGRGEIQTWALSFEGNKVTVNFENTDGFKAQFQGEKKD
jgi:hypothetical protein